MYALLLLLTCPCGQTPTAMPVILHRGQVDTSSAHTILDSIIRPGMTDRDKALAIYEFVRTHLYHWPAPREGERPEHFEYGVVYDPIKLFNVYGYGYCFQSRSVLENLWQAAGLEARSAGIGGHGIAEVFYDGTWHYLDADQQGYCRLEDGYTIASLEQIQHAPHRLLLNQSAPSQPFFPATKNPRAVYESRVLLAAYFADKNQHFWQHDKVVSGHSLHFTLLPGMRLRRYFAGQGIWHRPPAANIKYEYESGYAQPMLGPADEFSDRSYAHGTLWYQPDLTAGSQEYRCGVWREANVRQTDEGLSPHKPNPASCVFRIRLPYVISGYTTQGKKGVSAAALVSALFERQHEQEIQGIRVSVDGGQEWTVVWRNERVGSQRVVVDISRWVAGRYEYQLAFDLGRQPVGSRLSQLALATNFQVAPQSLPRVQPGPNRMLVKSQQRLVVDKWHPDLRRPDQFWRQVESQENVTVTNGALHSEQNRMGEIVWCYPAQPGTLVDRFHVNLGLHRDSQQRSSREHLQVDYACNSPDNWRPLETGTFAAYASHWSHHLDAGSRCPEGAKRLFVRLRMRSAPSLQIRDLQFYVWSRDELPLASSGELQVVHAWQEGDRLRHHRQAVSANDDSSYKFFAGDGVVNNHLELIPQREPGLQWRPGDPPLPAPELVTSAPTVTTHGKQLRSILQHIDRSPARGLRSAAASDLPRLAPAARRALKVLPQLLVEE